MRRPRLFHVLAFWCLGLAAAAQEAGGPEEGREREELVRRVVRGEVQEEEGIRAAERYFRKHLLRPRLDVGQAARYSIAEIYLERGEAAKAVARLQEVIEAAAKPDESVWVTHFNIAQLLRHRVGDVEKAVQELQKVQGDLEAFAQREIVEAWKAAGQPEKAAQWLEARLGAAQEVGERLALLYRLGEVYRQSGQPDKAVLCFERVTKEATPEQIESMRRRAIAQAKAAFDEIRRLQAEDRWEEVEAVRQDFMKLWGRLRLQGRREEADAMGQEMRKQQRELEKFQQERERAERQRAREGQEPEPKPGGKDRE